MRKNNSVLLGILLILVVACGTTSTSSNNNYQYNNSQNANPVPVNTVASFDTPDGFEEQLSMSGKGGGSDGCPGAPVQLVYVNARAYVCTQSDRLIVRKKPNKSSAEIARIYPGTQMTIIKGPECADNWSWWRIETDDGIVGWVAEGGDNVDPYFICPLP